MKKKKELTMASLKPLCEFNIAAQVWGVGRDTFRGEDYDRAEAKWQGCYAKLHRRLLHLENTNAELRAKLKSHLTYILDEVKVNPSPECFAALRAKTHPAP